MHVNVCVLMHACSSSISLRSPHCTHNWHAARCPKTPLMCIYVASGAVLGLPLTPYGHLKPPLATYRAARHVYKKSLSWPIQP